MAPHIFSRQTSATTNEIAGGLIAGFVCLLVLLCLLCFLRFHRSRTNKKQDEEGLISSFRGVPPTMTETNPLSTSIPIFNRNGLTASIAMPKKTITPKPSSHRLADKGVISSKLESSLASSAMSRPLSNSFNPSRPHSLSNLNPARSRQSVSSSGSTASTLSMSLTRGRPVRQLFDPVLPDELPLLRYREQLTVLRTFDDGWCLVARDTSRRSSRASRLSTLMKSNGDTVDIGLVPAWVFIKPVKGIAVTRPVRTSSVNALDISQNTVPAHPRDAVVSWSNFS